MEPPYPEAIYLTVPDGQDTEKGTFPFMRFMNGTGEILRNCPLVLKRSLPYFATGNLEYNVPHVTKQNKAFSSLGLIR